MKTIKLLFLIFTLLGVNLFAEHKIIDMENREITVPDKISGVVSVGGTPALNAFLFAFKKADIIQNGVEDENLKNMPFWKHQQWFMPKLFSLPQVSSNPPSWTPEFEKLALTKFDIALVNDTLGASLLEKRAYKTAIINWQGEDSIKRTMNFLGELFNMQEVSKAYDEYYNKVLNLINEKTSSIKDKKTALYIRMNNLSLPMVTTANTIFEKAGGISATSNITKEHISIDMEKLYVLNPDFLFVWGENDVKLALENPKFKDLKAVKNKQVYSIPMGAHFWTHYTPEQILCILWVAKKMYPEKFEDIDMKKETSQFYEEFMGTKLSSQQINEILKLKGKI
ncbi:MAG: ABC transporter substrate-binding protein [Arcobacter sp.]|jgi:iron complex transport system substrate-binding protein|uniref:ABC transporter substrate-binding protein n=1 Tax=unclassified Arcobacter TaxID=2593671 RepID=UPI000229615E|nr:MULTISPECIES: ABC transporter substrate-binding protein [unclassified Arcobacter]MDY3199960.1 ABC transporter substrate-binding protein [Arcobacter sp.]BAK73990.1 ABC transporter substrate binding component [Arcobacter sp. L]